MSSVSVERTTGRGTKGFRGRRLPRLIALLGGTTTLADCIVAIRYLIDRRHMVQEPAIEEYERTFARKIGIR